MQGRLTVDMPDRRSPNEVERLFHALIQATRGTLMRVLPHPAGCFQANGAPWSRGGTTALLRCRYRITSQTSQPAPMMKPKLINR